MPRNKFNPKPIEDIKEAEQQLTPIQEAEYKEIDRQDWLFDNNMAQAMFDAYRIDGKPVCRPSVSIGDDDVTPLLSAICLVVVELRRIANALEKQNENS